MTWTLENSVGNESRHIGPFVVHYTRGRGLDLGCGSARVLPHAIGMDMGNLYDVERVLPNIVGDIRDLSLFASASLSFIYSSHALEDIEDTRAALTEWWRVIEPGGHLVLYLPSADLYPRMGQPGANPNHKHDFLPQDILDHMKAVAEVAGTGCMILEDETRGDGDEYSFFIVARKTPVAEGWVYKPWRRKPNSTLLLRYGGWGDGIVALSAIKRLKLERDRHITVNTTPRCFEVFQGCPYIDDIIIQDTDQIPNLVLHDYWTRLGTRYDQVLNLSGSVEDSLLAVEGRSVAHDWPLAARQALLGSQNYYEKTHTICGVSHIFEPRFYPLAEERTWAEEQKTSIGKATVMIALTGSSVHKVWPHMDALVARIMLQTNCHVVLVGDESCQFLEGGWQKEPRVWRRSGVWSIRQTLAFAQQCEIVIGPETGVLNAVSAEPMRKVCMLSHSSHENLTKHWKNTVALEPQVSCHSAVDRGGFSGCHRMHYSFKNCFKHDLTHAAICATAIGPGAVFAAAFEPRIEGAKLVIAPLFTFTPEADAAIRAEAATLDAPPAAVAA